MVEGPVTRTPQSTRPTAPYERDGTLPVKLEPPVGVCIVCAKTINREDSYSEHSGIYYCLGCVPMDDTPAKHDANKPRYDLIPPEGIHAIARALTYGAEKYGPRDWEAGMPWGKYFAACMRHLWAWWWGEDEDRESGLSHLAHAACCVVFLIAYEARGVGEDDRKRRAE